MVVIKKKIYYKSVMYVFLTVLFAVISYLFLSSGFSTKTVVRVNYDSESEVNYLVNYKDSSYNSYDDGKYVSSMVKDIDIKYTYNNIMSEFVSGYYKYNVCAYVIAYEDDITSNLWERRYLLKDYNTKVLDENNINNIKIEDSIKIDFDKYRDEVYQFIEDYDINVNSYLMIRINILEFFNFKSLNNQYDNVETIDIKIPLTLDTFKINIDNINNRDSYYEFSNNESMNMILLVIGAFSLALAISFFIMIIRQFKYIYDRESKYNRELKKILTKYDDNIVRVNRFYVNRKYNMIYVDSFYELMDVYEKKNKLISFKEYKRGSEAIFVIIDGDDAWIYKFMADNL